MNSEAFNEYLLVMPDGEARGFNDLESAKAYINRYYQGIVSHDREEDDYNDVTELDEEKATRNVCTNLGAEEGKCEVYKLDDFIDKINEEVVFDYEKEEIISKLCEKHINLNVYNYNLDLILADTEVVDVMEPYGEAQ